MNYTKNKERANAEIYLCLARVASTNRIGMVQYCCWWRFCLFFGRKMSTRNCHFERKCWPKTIVVLSGTASFARWVVRIGFFQMEKSGNVKMASLTSRNRTLDTDAATPLAELSPSETVSTRLSITSNSDCLPTVCQLINQHNSMLFDVNRAINRVKCVPWISLRDH